MSEIVLGFNARISFPDGGAEQALKDGIELFRVAEQLGFGTGWVYQRHFDNYLASPLTFCPPSHSTRSGSGWAPRSSGCATRTRSCSPRPQAPPTCCPADGCSSG